nr:MAG TPA: hypothetical protein [Caudoviricetes sp.]
MFFYIFFYFYFHTSSFLPNKFIIKNSENILT